jgi:DNA-binding CsgD family transcriptional regulator
LDAAERLTSEMEARGIEYEAAWTRLAAARCRALLLAARHDLATAEALLTRALELNPTAPSLEQGRTLLALGRVQRRRREKRVAEATLECALTIFTHLRAESWAEGTRRELARIGISAPAPATLTATEAHVAELAASGVTNRAIASMLFLSPKTVEANLHRVYRKLGINSRAELRARGIEIGEPSVT